MRCARRSRSAGFSIAELLVVTTILGLMVGIGAPTYLEWMGRAPLAAAARELSMEYAAQRFKAVAMNQTHGLWFVQTPEGWGYYRVRDENRNGLRTAELKAGTDSIQSRLFYPQDQRGSAKYGFGKGDAFPGVPPRKRGLLPSDDPIRFGSSDLVSFSGSGHTSSGTVYLTDGSDRMWAVVLYGRSGRVRVFRWDPKEEQWKR